MNILMLRHSAGFEHSYLPNAEVALKQIGSSNGWNVVTTHRCDRISAENLAKQDLVVFATTGNLPFNDAQKAALLGFVRDGKAFLGIHNATDTCYDWPEYGQMLGGYFAGHPWHEDVNVIVEDTQHPATRMLGSHFRVVDEIYTFKNWNRSKTHVLMRLGDRPPAKAWGLPQMMRKRLWISEADWWLQRSSQRFCQAKQSGLRLLNQRKLPLP